MLAHSFCLGCRKFSLLQRKYTHSEASSDAQPMKMAAHLTHVFARHNFPIPRSRRIPSRWIRHGIFGERCFTAAGMAKMGKLYPKLNSKECSPIFSGFCRLLLAHSIPFFFLSSARVFPPFQQKTQPNSHNQKAKSSNAAAAALPFHLTARKFFIWFFTSTIRGWVWVWGGKHFSAILGCLRASLWQHRPPSCLSF